MRKNVRTGQNTRTAVRLTKELHLKVNEAATSRGYASPSAFIRAAITNELNGREELIGTEERIAGSFDRLSRDIFRVGRGQQALFALVDSLAKTVLTCMPEPPADAMSQAVASAKHRYDRLVKAAGQSMSAMQRVPCRILSAMPPTDDGRRVRLRPTKPRFVRNEGAAWSSGFKLLMHYTRNSRMCRNRRTPGKGKSTHLFHQRCALRVTYIGNKIRGQWKAHGRYLARESASRSDNPKAAGFNRECEGIDVAQQLETWQRAGDERLFKLIISPEFGDRLDLSRLARDLIKRVEEDLGCGLEWIGVEHHNTEHPHIHVTLRGLTTDGRSLRLRGDYIQHGIRAIAEDLCTRPLGYRTELDAADSARTEIAQKGFTSIDPRLQRNARQSGSEFEAGYFTVTVTPAGRGAQEVTRLHLEHEIARLTVLRQMGLAESIPPTVWRVRRDFEQILRGDAESE